MARMLSWIARPTIAVFALVFWTLFAGRTLAQENMHVSEPAVIVQNPFSNRAAAALEPRSSEPPRRGPASFQNPFTSTPASPPLAIPMRPGPISRWRRIASLIEPPRVAASADTSNAVAPLGALSNSAPIGQPALNWDRLPPVEELAARRAIRTTSIDAPIVDNSPDSPWPPDPIGFAPTNLAQPIWMVPDQVGARTAAANQAAFGRPAADPFDSLAADGARVRSAVAEFPSTSSPSLDFGNVVEAAAESLAAGAPLVNGAMHEPMDMPAAPLKVPDMLPVIVSDYVDTPDGWYAQAESAAQSANTIEELSSVTRLCGQGLRSGPTPEIATSLRRLAAWAHNRRGELLIDAGQPQPALGEFQTAISLDPECSLAVHNRAVTLAQQNRPSEALRDFNRVIELNPGLAVAFRNRAELHASLGRFEEAVGDYSLALEQLSNDAALYRLRAYSLQRLGEFDGALADLNQALRLSPADVESYTQRAELAADRGDFNQAVRDLQRAIQLNPNAAEPYRGLAWLLATCSNPRYRDAKQAVELAKEAATLSPTPDPFLWDTLAAAYASAGQFDLAVSAVRQAIAIAPADYTPSLRGRQALYQQRQAYFNSPSGGVRTAAFEEQSPR